MLTEAPMLTEAVTPPASINPHAPQPLTKCGTGVPGLDDVLNGGLPEGRTTLVTGGPGCGKSVFGLQFIYAGAVSGEPGIYFSFEERPDNIRANAMTFGWDLAALEARGLLAVVDGRLDAADILSGSLKSAGVLSHLEKLAAELDVKRIVIDGADVLSRLFDNVLLECSELYNLHERLMARGITTVLTAKLTSDQYSTSRYDFLDFMADCVIALDQRVRDQVSIRHLRVVKYRGSGFGRHEYPCVIDESGLNLFPVTALELSARTPGKIVPTGHSELDVLLRGGYRRGSSLLISGFTGAGKTTVAATLAEAAARRGERALFASFEESPAELTTAMRSAGIDLAGPLENGLLMIESALPEAMTIEHHLLRLSKSIQAYQPALVVIDSISVLERLGPNQLAIGFVVRLLALCKQRGVTCILTHERPGMGESIASFRYNLAAMMDVIMLLRYVPENGEIRREFHIAKAHGADHSHRIHPFRISSRGIEFPTVIDGRDIGEVNRSNCEWIERSGALRPSI